jgi:hypothetical protein
MKRLTHLLPAALLAALPALARAATDLEAVVVPIAVTGTVFGFTAVIVGLVAYTRHRTQRLRHETIRLAIEKGQALPPDLLDAARPPGDRSAERDLRRGLVLVAVGLGIGLYLALAPFSGGGHNWSVGFIPGLIGVAYLVAYAVGRRPSAPPPGKE